MYLTSWGKFGVNNARLITNKHTANRNTTTTTTTTKSTHTPQTRNLFLLPWVIDAMSPNFRLTKNPFSVESNFRCLWVAL